MRRLLQSYLPSVEFVEFEDGQCCLEYLQAAQWFRTTDDEDLATLLISDINMPLMDGFELLERAALLMDERGIPGHAMQIAIMSSSTASTDQKRASAISIVDQFLCKPIDPWKLDQLVSESAPKDSV